MRNRLMEFANNETRLLEADLDHLEKCTECLRMYAKSILQVAKTRAEDKLKDRSKFTGLK